MVLWKYKDQHKWKNIAITILGAFIYSFGITTFIIPARLYTGGFTGLSLIIRDLIKLLTDGRFEPPVSILWFLVNIPVFILGYKEVGRRFTFLSVLAVFVGSLAMEFIPPIDLGVQDGEVDKLLFAMIGGVVTGTGVGLTLRVGASTGGMDIISQYFSLKTSKSVGHYSFLLNACLIIVSGLLNDWMTALYTIVNIFISTLIVDRIHTRHHKLTLFVVTDRHEEMVKAIHAQIMRGITIFTAQGAYTKQEKQVLFIVITSYELYPMLNIIREVDPSAFVDVIKSQHVYGHFILQKLE